jgi:hypothetical protein
MLITRITNTLLSIKERLPANGDWLYVTETPVKTKAMPNDMAIKHNTPAKVLQDIHSDELEVIKLIYERAKSHEAFIYNSGNQVREKAKTLLSTAGFISAILLGVVAFLLSTVVIPRIWIFLVEVFLFLFLSMHFIRSLSIAMQVMTREEYVRSSPSEFLSIPATTNNKDAIKDDIAQIVAYSNQTHEFIRQRGNKLILGQHAFRYGLIYFVILVFFHIIAIGFDRTHEKKDPWQTRFTITENKISSLLSIQEQEKNEIVKLRQKSILSPRESEQHIKRVKQGDSTQKKPTMGMCCCDICNECDSD